MSCRPSALKNSLILILALGAGSTALAAGQADALVVSEPYVRAAPPGVQAAAAFMVLRNTAGAPLRVIKGESPQATTTELHTHRQEDGMMKMRPVDEIAVPAGASVELKPGGLHVMLIGPKVTLKEGDTVSLSLGLADGSSKTITLPVRGGSHDRMHRH